MNPKSSKSMSLALVEGKDKQLSQSEAAHYETLKTTIVTKMDTINAAFADIGRALREIRDGRLYRQDFGTFDEFISATLGGARAGYGYRLIRAADTLDELLAEGLSEESETPATEGAARELRRVPLAKRAEVSKRATELSKGAGKARPDQGTIRQAAIEIVADERIAPPDVEKAITPPPVSTIAPGLPTLRKSSSGSRMFGGRWNKRSTGPFSRKRKPNRLMTGFARFVVVPVTFWTRSTRLSSSSGTIAVRGDQLETENDVPKAMADNKIPEAEKQKMLEAFENGQRGCRAGQKAPWPS